MLIDLITRLKRHHMFRVASWYATAAWVIILIANQVFPDIGLTRADVRVVIAVVALGFPVVLVLAWMFIPPSQESPTTLTSWKRLRWRLGAVFALAVIAFVVGSSIYLWYFNGLRLDGAIANEEAGTSKTGQALAILPFQKSGSVDDAFMEGLRANLESTLGSFGSVRIISGSALPVTQGASTPLADIAHATGATLVVQGSVQRPDKDGPIIVNVELVAVEGDEPLFNWSHQYPAAAHALDIEQEVTTRIAGPVRFMTSPDDWLAHGYKTTQNPRAMLLFRRAMMGYAIEGDPLQLLHETLELDPKFAQAHAYLAILEPQHSDASPEEIHNIVENEITQAEALAPGLPEAQLARASLERWANHDSAAAIKALAPIQQVLGKSTEMHRTLAFSLRSVGRWQDALHEFEETVRIDPYFANGMTNASLLRFAMHDYDHADSDMQQLLRLYPMYASVRLWRAQVKFSARGDVAALAHDVDVDWSRYTDTPESSAILDAKLEVLHFEDKYEELIKGLKDYPDDCLAGFGYGPISWRTLCVDSLSAESLRLMGKQDEARHLADRRLPYWTQKLAQDPDNLYDGMVVAQLQAFGGQSGPALARIAPYLKRIRQPGYKWTEHDAQFISDAAVVLTWCGERQQATQLLTDTIDITWGPHAGVLAHDPVWRPLYKEPAFVALLAAHGQQLAYAH